MLQAVENIFSKIDEPARSCLYGLHSIALRYDEQMGEDCKYGMPLITYKGKPFCYLWVDKKTNHPYLLMVRGDKINHPALEQGDRKKMKTFTVDPNVDIPIEEIDEIFRMAMKLYK